MKNILYRDIIYSLMSYGGYGPTNYDIYKIIIYINGSFIIFKSIFCEDSLIQNYIKHCIDDNFDKTNKIKTVYKIHNFDDDFNISDCLEIIKKYLQLGFDHQSLNTDFLVMIIQLIKTIKIQNIILEEELKGKNCIIHDYKLKELKNNDKLDKTYVNNNIVLENKINNIDNIKLQKLFENNEKLDKTFDDILEKKNIKLSDNKLIEEYNESIDDYDEITENNNKLKKEYNELIDDYDEITENNNKLKKEYNELIDDYDEITENNNKLKKKYNELIDDYDEITESNSKLNKEYNKLKNSYYILDDTQDNVIEEFEKLNKKYNKLKKKYNILAVRYNKINNIKLML